MSFESDFNTTLLDFSGLTNLVSVDNIQPGFAAEGIGRPFVVWTRVFSEPQSGLDGFTSGLERVRVQVDCYAESFDSVIAIASQVRAAVDAVDGDNNLRGVCINEMDDFEEDTRLYRRMVEFSVFHRS